MNDFDRSADLLSYSSSGGERESCPSFAFACVRSNVMEGALTQQESQAQELGRATVLSVQLIDDTGSRSKTLTFSRAAPSRACVGACCLCLRREFTREMRLFRRRQAFLRTPFTRCEVEISLLRLKLKSK